MRPAGKFSKRIATYFIRCAFCDQFYDLQDPEQAIRHQHGCGPLAKQVAGVHVISHSYPLELSKYYLCAADNEEVV